MSAGYQIVVCGSIVPDPLQTLEPVTGPAGPALKNEMMLPAVLDPWAAHALYEAAHLAKNAAGSKVWLVSLGPKAKLQQVMMTVAQKVPFELVALDGPAGGFTDASEVAAVLAEAIQAIPGLDRSRLLVFGGWESASRGAGATMQMVGERLGIVDQFQGVDELTVGGTARSESWSASRAASTRSRLRRTAGGPGLGHGQSARAAQQSPGRHGQHAHHHAVAAARQAGKGRRRGRDLRPGLASQPATRNESREGPVGRRDRARDRGMDHWGVKRKT